MDQIYVTTRLQTLLTRAESEAKRLKDEYVSVEHVLLAATDEKAFKDLGHHPRPADADAAGGPRQRSA